MGIHTAQVYTGKGKKKITNAVRLSYVKANMLNPGRKYNE